mgnify:CR=1 FL=1
MKSREARLLKAVFLSLRKLPLGFCFFIRPFECLSS